MTLFERDYKEALEGDEKEVITRRRKELQQLEHDFKFCKNGFRRQCIKQEYDRKKAELDKIDALF